MQIFYLFVRTGLILIISASAFIISCSKDDAIVGPPGNNVNMNINYESPVEVQIMGYTGNAMEPFISPDNNYLFFNNINDAVSTKLHFATRVNDSTFNYAGELDGANQTAIPHLDAVAGIFKIMMRYRQ